MGDVFKEQIVKRLSNTKDRMKKIGIVFLGIFIFLVSLFIPYVNQFSFFILAAAIFGIYYSFTFINVEFEYLYTNGELDIDIIYNRSRRKRRFSGYVKDFEIMAHVEDKDHIHAFDSATETLDYSSGRVLPNTYAFLTTYKGKRVKILIEPNDMMIQAFSSSLTPRKFFKRQGVINA